MMRDRRDSVAPSPCRATSKVCVSGWHRGVVEAGQTGHQAAHAALTLRGGGAGPQLLRLQHKHHSHHHALTTLVTTMPSLP